MNNTYIGNISFFKGDNPKEPFQIEGNILTPILIYVGGLDFSDPIPLFDYIIEDEPDDGFTN